MTPAVLMADNSDFSDFEEIESQEAELGPEVIAAIQTWLQPTDYNAESGEFQRHLSSQAPGTGQWIANTSAFRQWHDSDDHGSLWIKGVPGAGKSVIVASMIEHLQDVERVPVLFFFFRYVIVGNRTPRSLIRDWLSQLLPHSIHIQAILHPLLGSELEDASDRQLWEYLLAGLSSVGKAYCIVDALDEMALSTNNDFLQWLNDLATFRPNSIKLLMTSRPKQYLQSGLRDASIVHISLHQDLVGKDIAAFVSHRLSPVLHDQDQRESLTSTICSRSQGLFLYARLLIDQIVPGLSSAQPVDIGHLVTSLPVGLEDIYETTLLQQAKELGINHSVQILLLELVTHSSRALRLNELADILSQEFPKLAKRPKDVARFACSPLLEILEDETVQVIHHSFTEFILGSEQSHVFSDARKRQFPVVDPLRAHRRLTMACLDYLQSGLLNPRKHEKVPNDGPCNYCGEEKDDCICDQNETSYDYSAARLEHPFLQYAVSNWAYHASHYDLKDDGFFHAISNFINSEGSAFRTWVSLEWDARGPEVQLPSALHIAAFAGLTNYLDFILQEGKSIDTIDAYNRTPLWWAARRNHFEVVSMLIQHGAKPDAPDEFGVKPLHEAAKKNNATIVQLLLQVGVPLLTPKTEENFRGRRFRGGEISTKGETAIEYACRNGHSETIVVMIPFAQPDTLAQVLGKCCQSGKSEAVRVVLDKSNISPNSKYEGATALYLATCSRSLKCVETLLARGADVNATSQWWVQKGIRIAPAIPRAEDLKKPLNILAMVWTKEFNIVCQAILKMLVDAGADLEFRDGDQETPLLKLFPLQWGTPSQVAVTSFLQAGADVSATDRTGKTVLHRFLSTHRDIKMTEILLSHGAKVDARDGEGGTIWHALLYPRSSVQGTDSLDEVIKFLLDNGAGSLVQVEDDTMRSPLSAAAGNKDCSVVSFRLLLEACADEDARTRCLWSFGRRYNQGESVKPFIQELLSVGVSLETRDSSGRTPLLASTHDSEGFQILLDLGARIDAVDPNGRGVLHHYISDSGNYVSTDRLRTLVEQGLDPCKVDDHGNTILHEAAKIYEGNKSHIELIKQILDYGVLATARNHLGQTSLHVYFEENRVRFFRQKPTDEQFWTLLLWKGSGLDINVQDEHGLTILHLAAMRSEINVSRLLLDGADATISTKNEENILHLACRARQSNAVGLCLHRDANQLKDKTNASGQTPLHLACRSGRPESVYYLLKAGADINVKDNQGRTPLHACAEFAIEQKIWFLLEHPDGEASPYLPDRFRPSGKRHGLGEPWYSSSWQQYPTFTASDTVRIGVIVTMLLQAGADSTARDKNNNTSLDLAIAYQCHEMAKALSTTIVGFGSAQGVDPKDYRLRTTVALHQTTAIRTLNRPDFPLQELLDHPASYLLFMDADDIQFIAESGGNLTEDKNGFERPSFLHTAAQEGFVEIIDRLGHLAQFFDDSESVRALVEKSQTTSRYHDHFMPILQAACDRELPNLQMMEFLVDKSGVNVNARAFVTSEPPYGTDLVLGPTALHRLAQSAYWWQLEGITLLVGKGAVVDSRNEQGETPLHIASWGHVKNNILGSGKDFSYWAADCVQLLLDLGADPNIIDNQGLSPLNKASSRPDIMRILLARGADLAAGTSNPLFSAIRDQDLQALAIILDAGASANAVDITESCHIHYNCKDQERTALFCACFPYPFNLREENSVPLVKLLIERGADVYATLNERETLIHYVFEHAEQPFLDAFLDYFDTIDFSRRDQSGRTVLLAACDGQHPLVHLLDLGVDVLAVDNDGKNILHHLLDNPDIGEDFILQALEYEICKALVCQKDSKGSTPLQYALSNLRPVVCEKLMTLGANLLEADPAGATALHHIAAQYLREDKPHNEVLRQSHEKEHYEACLRLWRRFLDLGGNINARDIQVCPPLFYYLLSQAKVNVRENECCHVANFSHLFDEATDVSARNADGETALHVIARRDNKWPTQPGHDRTSFEFMVSKGLDPLAEDAKGRSSLDVAAACGKDEILELFQYRS